MTFPISFPHRRPYPSDGNMAWERRKGFQSTRAQLHFLVYTVFAGRRDDFEPAFTGNASAPPAALRSHQPSAACRTDFH
jgi:hypothetical protein